MGKSEIPRIIVDFKHKGNESGENETVMDRCCGGRYEKFGFPKMVDDHWLQETKAYCWL